MLDKWLEKEVTRGVKSLPGFVVSIWLIGMLHFRIIHQVIELLVLHLVRKKNVVEEKSHIDSIIGDIDFIHHDANTCLLIQISRREGGNFNVNFFVEYIVYVALII